MIVSFRKMSQKIANDSYGLLMLYAFIMRETNTALAYETVFYICRKMKSFAHFILLCTLCG